jgi:hypothetical protein
VQTPISGAADNRTHTEIKRRQRRENREIKKRNTEHRSTGSRSKEGPTQITEEKHRRQINRQQFQGGTNTDHRRETQKADQQAAVPRRDQHRSQKTRSQEIKG